MAFPTKILYNHLFSCKNYHIFLKFEKNSVQGVFDTFSTVWESSNIYGIYNNTSASRSWLPGLTFSRWFSKLWQDLSNHGSNSRNSAMIRKIPRLNQNLYKWKVVSILNMVWNFNVRIILIQFSFINKTFFSAIVSGILEVFLFTLSSTPQMFF